MLYEYLLKHSSYQCCPRDYSYNNLRGEVASSNLFQIYILTSMPQYSKNLYWYFLKIFNFSLNCQVKLYDKNVWRMRLIIELLVSQLYARAVRSKMFKFLEINQFYCQSLSGRGWRGLYTNILFPTCTIFVRYIGLDSILSTLTLQLKYSHIYAWCKPDFYATCILHIVIN